MSKYCCCTPVTPYVRLSLSSYLSENQQGVSKEQILLEKTKPLVTSSHVKFQLSEFDISQSHFYRTEVEKNVGNRDIIIFMVVEIFP